MGHTDAAMFLPTESVVQPSEVLYNRPVLIERGSFRPVTNVTLGMLDDAIRSTPARVRSVCREPSVLMEMTLNNLIVRPGHRSSGFLARADILGALTRR